MSVLSGIRRGGRGVVGLWAVVWAGVAIVPAAGSGAAQVEVRTIDGSFLHGQYAGIGPNDVLRLHVDGTALQLRLDQVERIVFDTPQQPPRTSADDTDFHLADGGHLTGRIVAAIDDGIAVRTAFAESVALKFEQLAAIRFPADPDPPQAREVFENERAARLPGKDVLVSRTEQGVKAVRGTIVSLGPTRGRFVFNEQERAFDVSSIYALVCARGIAPTGPAPARIHLADGAVLSARLLPSGDAQVAFETSFGARLELSCDWVRTITLHSDRVVYVSDLEPVRQDVQGLLHAPWPVRLDASVTNAPIRLDNHVFEKGLGVHARTQLVYALAGEFERFCATIGIDDAVRPRGDVVFRVLGDGHNLFNSDPVTGRDAAQDLNIDVTGVKELTLLVDFGEQMDLGDHADWADARVLRPADAPRNAPGGPSEP